MTRGINGPTPSQGGGRGKRPGMVRKMGGQRLLSYWRPLKAREPVAKEGHQTQSVRSCIPPPPPRHTFSEGNKRNGLQYYVLHTRSRSAKAEKKKGRGDNHVNATSCIIIYSDKKKKKTGNFVARYSECQPSVPSYNLLSLIY